MSEMRDSSAPALFGGSVAMLPGSDRAALRWLLTAASLGTLSVLDRLWRFTNATGSLRAPGRRLWWRLKAGQHSCYICHEPPETRFLEPTEPIDHIEDAPEPDGDHGSLSQLLRDVIEGMRIPSWDLDSIALHQTARALVDEPQGVAADGFAHFGRVAARAREDPLSGLQVAIDTVEEECLLALRTPADRFCAALTLLCFQGELGRWFEECDYGRAEAYLEVLLKDVKRDDPQGLTETLTKYGNQGYANGKRWLSNALAAFGSTTMARRLLIAHDNFRRAESLAQLNEQFQCGASLTYSETVANEGATCAWSGFFGSVSFFTTHPDQYIDQVRKMALKKGNGPALRGLSSPLSPFHPRLFSMALLAAATSDAPEPAGSQAVADLERIGRKYENVENLSDISIMEQSWIDLQLMKHFRRRGNAEKEELYRWRVSGRILIEQRLK